MGIFDFLFGAQEQQEDERPRTTTIDDKWGIPAPGERMLVLHEDCQILKMDFIGLRTVSFQYLTCCVTDKRIMLIPQDTLPNRKAVSLIGKIIGVNPVAKYMMLRELYDNRINHIVEINRNEIEKIEIGMDEKPEMQGVSIIINGERLLLGCKALSYAFDIQGAFYNPQWDWDE